MSDHPLALAFEQHAPRIRSYLLTRTHDADLADDLVSEVFVTAVRRFDAWEDRGFPLSAWLYVIAHSRLIDHYRSVGRRRPPLSIESWCETEDTTEPLADALDAAACIRLAIGRLCPRFRAVLWLRYVEGWELSEIAQAWGVSANAVKAVQHRALAAMRAALQSE